MSVSIDPSLVKAYSLNAKWAQTHRPDCVSAIGLLLLSWNRAEEQLAWSISGILGVTLIGDHDIGFSHDWIMSTVMAETGTVHARIKIVDAILMKALKDHELKDQWILLKKRVRKLAEMRNIVVHTCWCWSENVPQYLLKIEDDGSIWGWNEEHFINLCEKIKIMEDDLHKFMISVASAFREGSLNSPYLQPKKISA